MILTVTPNPSIDVWMEVPVLHPGGFHRAAPAKRLAGGKGLNVSRVIHALGGTTIALAAAGGETGRELKRLLSEEGIPKKIISIAGQTRLNYKVRSRQSTKVTELNMPGPIFNRSDALKLNQALDRLLPAASCCVFSGNTPQGLPPHFYRDAVFRAHQEAVVTVLDASGAALRLSLSAKPWLVKPNQEEAAQLLGRAVNSLARAKEAVRLLCSRGAAMAVVSLGDQGALWGARKSAYFWHAKPPRVRTQSTVGCGDALLAGLLHGWSEGSTWPEALALSVACGSAAAAKPPGKYPTASEVRKLLKNIALKSFA